MTELEKLCEEALYETVQTLEDGRSIVRDNASGKLFYKKRLAVFDTKVFDWLKAHRSRYVPKIESYWQDGDELVVIEELIQGETLEQLLSENENSLPFEERIRILTEVCDGLAFLHSADPPIIHRDLKASNIMLRTRAVRVCRLGRPDGHLCARKAAGAAPSGKCRRRPHRLPRNPHRSQKALQLGRPDQGAHSQDPREVVRPRPGARGAHAL